MISAQRQTPRSTEMIFLWGANIERNMKIKFLQGTHVTDPDHVTADITQGSVLCLVTRPCLTLCDPMGCSPPGSSVHGDSPGRNTGVGCYSLLQIIFTTEGLNPGLLHCKQILNCLSHQESPWILEWVAYPFSRGSSQPRNRTRVSCIAGGFFTKWAMREAQTT